jgi:hypothetical protein
MCRITKGVLGAAFIVAVAPSALADPPAAPGVDITVKGNAPAVCSLGAWTKLSGPGAFSGGTNAVVTFSNSDMVNGDAMSVLGPEDAVTMRAPFLCNTQLTYGLETMKGKFSLDSEMTPPAGFSRQWDYSLAFGTADAGGGYVSNAHHEWDSSMSGGPYGGESIRPSTYNSLKAAYFLLTFTPHSQAARMVAGNYSETLTLTISQAQ